MCWKTCAVLLFCFLVINTESNFYKAITIIVLSRLPYGFDLDNTNKKYQIQFLRSAQPGVWLELCSGLSASSSSFWLLPACYTIVDVCTSAAVTVASNIGYEAARQRASKIHPSRDAKSVDGGCKRMIARSLERSGRDLSDEIDC
ncbi:hypothetical protein PoB_002949100 [Plakobranchus ocellatus]|uniref:Secreted protein n=1 Tax=Plakobranchus ocellatus TaxID=259542 RepID=A0AAV4A8G6_9GAST|nr:hypothetical protein PoB_002949100 [Plakobranchus ocellatus]